jgi:hypothetical protein
MNGGTIHAVPPDPDGHAEEAVKIINCRCLSCPQGCRVSLSCHIGGDLRLNLKAGAHAAPGLGEQEMVGRRKVRDRSIIPFVVQRCVMIPHLDRCG